MPTLAGRGVLLAGAESPLAPTIAAALAEAGANLALVSLKNDAEAAFNVQRLARKTGSALSQAIDGSNDAAVRIMVRQVAKALRGLDAIVTIYDNSHLREHGERELEKARGAFIVASSADAALTSLADAGRSG
jgi:enoyl-[acyl-carrier-protein] reductase (NADH)